MGCSASPASLPENIQRPAFETKHPGTHLKAAMAEADTIAARQRDRFDDADSLPGSMSNGKGKCYDRTGQVDIPQIRKVCE